MPQIPSILDLLKAGVHFGHQDNRWHPKMAPFIFTERNGVHILDLEKTQAKLTETLDFIKQSSSQGKTFLLVATKEQAKPIVKKYAEEIGVPYITERWLGGLLTNFEEIHQSLFKKIRRLKSLRDTGEITKYTKKEQGHILKEIAKLERVIGSVEKMDKRPEIIFIVDTKRDKTAFEESKKIGLKIVALCDTNTNPENIDYPIPSNDDATRAIDLMVRLVCEAIKEGQNESPRVVDQKDQPAGEKLTAEKKETAGRAIFASE